MNYHKKEDFGYDTDDMDFESRIVSTELRQEDVKVDVGLRPQTLQEYIGQEKVKENLKIYIDAAKARDEQLDHVLLYGPPGLGKTTLSNIIANEMGVNIRITSGPAIEKQGDLAALLTNLGENDVLFIDEIHRLPRMVEEILYPAMEDYALDIIIGKGPASSACKIYADWRYNACRTIINTTARSVWRFIAPGIVFTAGALYYYYAFCWHSQYSN